MFSLQSFFYSIVLPILLKLPFKLKEILRITIFLSLVLRSCLMSVFESVNGIQNKFKALKATWLHSSCEALKYWWSGRYKPWPMPSKDFPLETCVTICWDCNNYNLSRSASRQRSTFLLFLSSWVFLGYPPFLPTLYDTQGHPTTSLYKNCVIKLSPILELN